MKAFVSNTMFVAFGNNCSTSGCTRNSLSGSTRVSYKETLASTILLAGAVSKFPPAVLVTLGVGLTYTAYVYFKEAKPNDLSWDRGQPWNPDNRYRINNNNFFQNQHPKWPNWLVYGIGAAAAGYSIYENWPSPDIQVAPIDNTYVVTPPIIIP